MLSFTVVKIICTLYMKGQRYKNVLLSKFCFCYEFLKSLIRQNKFALLIVPYGYSYCQTTQNMFYEKISCLCFYCVYKKLCIYKINKFVHGKFFCMVFTHLLICFRKTHSLVALARSFCENKLTRA